MILRSENIKNLQRNIFPIFLLIYSVNVFGDIYIEPLFGTGLGSGELTTVPSGNKATFDRTGIYYGGLLRFTLQENKRYALGGDYRRGKVDAKASQASSFSDVANVTYDSSRLGFFLDYDFLRKSKVNIRGTYYFRYKRKITKSGLSNSLLDLSNGAIHAGTGYALGINFKMWFSLKVNLEYSAFIMKNVETADGRVFNISNANGSDILLSISCPIRFSK